ncbi:hypothetical protein BDR26DRAFT_869872 [Obelidium mucronatum]|nr:hypothetical protein BDR26DRAFT_869872 [Obelidium mucronatum]
MTGALEVIVLENVGRETHTYLTHIARRYDTLADHTLYMQSDPHHVTAFMNRFEKQFSIDTGFLPLGPVGVMPFSDFEHLKELFVLVLGEFPPQNQFTYTWNGQFLTSKETTHKTSLQTYRYLESLLSAPQGHFIHEEKKDFKQDSSPSDPIFGHSMERAMPILFHCWEPAVLADTCDAEGEKPCQCKDNN